MREPASAISRSTACGTSAARRCAPDQPGTIPIVVSGSANWACGAAILRSLVASNSNPPPNAMPFTAAIRGTGNRARRSNKRCPFGTHSRENCAASSADHSLISAPVQNAFSPAPVITTARIVRSRSTVIAQSSSASSIPSVSALPLAGLSIVTISVAPRLSCPIMPLIWK